MQDAMSTEVRSVMERVDHFVGELNEALGLEYPYKAALGYIGNVNGFRPGTPAYRDDRLWSVFLPHPNRVGTARDRLGEVRTDDLDGWRRMLTLVHGAVILARWEQQELRWVRSAMRATA